MMRKDRITLSVKDQIHSTEARVPSSESLVFIIEGQMPNLHRVTDEFTLRTKCRAQIFVMSSDLVRTVGLIDLVVGWLILDRNPMLRFFGTLVS